jgi:hypothetical protein
MALLSRTNEWNQRVHFPTAAKAPLGWGYEYWILDPAIYEGHVELKARAAEVHRRQERHTWTKRQLAAELSDHLLEDVLAAAGGVEHSILAFRDALARAQAWADQIEPKLTPETVPTGIADISVVDAWYEFANLLSWARVLEERLDRRGRGKLPNQGLMHALKPMRLKKRVTKLTEDLRAGPLGETRFLANFTLHSALVRNPNSGARLDKEGHVTLPIPDKQTGPIGHWKAMTWDERRDGVVFAEELWASIEAFMEGLIQAFEKAVPRRFRREPPETTV